MWRCPMTFALWQQFPVQPSHVLLVESYSRETLRQQLVLLEVHQLEIHNGLLVRSAPLLVTPRASLVVSW